MSLVVSNNGNQDFERPSQGVIQAVCANIYDIGMHETEYMGQKKVVHQIIILWELDQRITKGEFAGKRFVISKYYNFSLFKSNLLKDLVSWRGKDFTEEEAKGFDLEKLIGANCLINVGESKNGKPKVTGIMKLPVDKYEKMTPELSRDYIPQWVYDAQIKGGLGQNSTMDISDKPDLSDPELPNECPF